MYHNFILRSSVDGHLDCFHVLAIINRAAVRTLGYVCLFELWFSQASLVAQTVKYLSAMRETWVRSLGWEDPLEKGKAAHSSILDWRIPWTV